MSITATRLLPLSVILLGWLVFLWGIQRELPYEPFIDEPIFVQRAIHMASTGDPNPRWFGNPGSTTIYPLAAIYHFWFGLIESGSILRPDPRLAVNFATDASIYYLIGRLLTIAYGLLTVALTFVLGRKAVGREAGLLASLLLIFYPTFVWHTTVVRTDTSAMFFVALALWFCYQMTDEPRLRHFVLAGSAIGLALSSRYLMISIYAVYAGFFLLSVQRWRQEGKLLVAWKGLAVGGLVSAVLFALSSPFFFLDFNTAWQNLLVEARSTHIGADGLNYWERTAWYLTMAIPQSIKSLQVIALFAGIGWSIYQRDHRLLMLTAFLLVYVATISVPALHWQRWTIQISPVLSLLVAYGVDRVFRQLAVKHLSERSYRWAMSALICILLFQPALQTAVTVTKLRSTSTRIEAREWIVQNVSPGSRFIAELYTAPLTGEPFSVTIQNFLPDKPFESYFSGDFDFVMTSSEISNRFVADPARYGPQIDFYEQLSHLPLVHEFIPGQWQSGSTIRIYKLSPSESKP